MALREDIDVSRNSSLRAFLSRLYLLKYALCIRERLYYHLLTQNIFGREMVMNTGLGDTTIFDKSA